ncbi:hypothetical protein, conserved [Eimeria tenella]|uniref:Uncharacterized protein n=1 Tax=Eimeria tenella TaxID=5802 RepID=U6KZE1_EIMTE|nr:hypothetical protein, conserved [Eimeria tenella]CDJ42298.1 hypothetical protein, conserved [Eimeria tenella]|eukprot:XP_013233048.1 hypothetical protein, conserved [Eimeria tenella]
MAAREHFYLALHGLWGLCRGRQTLVCSVQTPQQFAAAQQQQQKQRELQTPSAVAAAAAISQRQQVFHEGPLFPYDFNWIAAVRASRTLRAAVRRGLQQQQQQQQQHEQQEQQRYLAYLIDRTCQLQQQLNYCCFVKPSFLTSHFAIRPLEALIDSLLLQQRQQQQQQQQKQQQQHEKLEGEEAAAACRGLTLEQQRLVDETSSRFCRAVAKATTRPELVVAAACLVGSGAKLLQQLYKTDSRGALHVPYEGSNYETVLALLQTLNPKPSSPQSPNPKPSAQALSSEKAAGKDLVTQWARLRNEAHRPQQQQLLQQLLLLLQQRQQIAASCGYSCWAELRIKRQTAEGHYWRQVPLLLRSIGLAAEQRAPQQLRNALRQQQQQQQQQREQQPRLQQWRPTVDQWLAAALRAYGRGASDLEAAAWFPESLSASQLPHQLAAALGLRLEPLLKKQWRGYGRRARH